MNVTAVKSATLTAIAYDENLGLLRLEFRSRVATLGDVWPQHCV